MTSTISMVSWLQLGIGIFCFILRVKSHRSEVPVTIEFNKKALNKDSEEYKTLRNGVKKVLGVVVGLLKDRACAEDDPPSKKKARIEEYRSKK